MGDRDMGEDYINEALELLKQFEGFREHTYLDGNGIPTIGYGFTDPELVKKGRISRAEADRRLLLEARKREVEVRKRIKNWDNLSNGSKSALLSYYYNYPAGFKDTTRFMGYWNKGDYNAAINEVNAGMNDKNNRGLRDRRLKEQEMLRRDSFLFPQKKKTYWDTVSPQEIPMWMPPTSAQQYSQRQTDDKQRVWDIFENNAVAYGHKKESVLPPTNKLIDKGKEDFVASVMNAPSLYGDYSPQYPQLIIPKLTKGKDMPKFDPGKDSEQVERGGVVYNVDPSAIGASELNVTTPNVNVRSNIGARDAYNKKVAQFVSRYPYGAGGPPVEPGLELTFPEFDLLTLVSEVGNLGTRTTNNTIKNNFTKEVPDAISAVASPRQAAAARRALSKRFDPEKLTGSSIADDIAKYYGKNYDQYPTQVKKSIENSVYPRMREMRPWLTDNQFKSAFNYAADGKYTAYPVKTFQAANGPESRITASYYPDTDHIAVRAGRITDDLGHEIEHKLDEAIPLTKQEDDILSSAYKQIAKDERKTTNYEARKALLGPYADQNLSIQEQNKIIDAAADEEIFEAVAKSNGYGYDFMEALRESDQLTIEIANAIRQAMKKVGAYSAPVVGSAALYNSMKDSGILPTQVLTDGLNEYNKGKNIYIKPSKRGTFTAAAKKHGKSVQAFASQVLSNPGKYSKAMRKKAQFARNASKWGK